MNERRQNILLLTFSFAVSAVLFLCSFLRWELLLVPPSRPSVRVWTITFENLFSRPAWPTFTVISEILASEPFSLFVVYLFLLVIGLAGFQRVASFYRCSPVQISLSVMFFGALGLEGLYPAEAILDFVLLPWFFLFVARSEKQLSLRALVVLAFWSCFGIESWLALPIYSSVLVPRLFRERRFVSVNELISLTMILILVAAPQCILLGEFFIFPFSTLLGEQSAIIANALGLQSPNFHALKTPAILFAALILAAPFSSKKPDPVMLSLLIVSLITALFWSRYLWVFCLFGGLSLARQFSGEAKDINFFRQDIVNATLGILLVGGLLLSPVNILSPVGERLNSVFVGQSNGAFKKPLVLREGASLAVRYGVPLFIEFRPYLALLKSHTSERVVIDDYEKLVSQKEGWEQVVRKYDFDMALLPTKRLVSGALRERLGWTEVVKDRWQEDEWSLMLPPKE